MLHGVPDQPLDLTSPEVTRRLLRNPRDWRERAVETLRISSAQFVHRERSLQCRPLFRVVSDLVGVTAQASSHAFVVLPLGLLPKQPLLEFHVTGPVDQPVLLRRPDIAEREAALVIDYAQEAGLGLAASVRTVLPLLLGFTEGSWAAVKSSVGPRRDPVRVYLETGLSGPLDPGHLERLRAASQLTHRVLDPYNEASPDSTSAAESPFLVVPVLVEDRYVADVEQAVVAVEHYASFVERRTISLEPSVPARRETC